MIPRPTRRACLAGLATASLAGRTRADATNPWSRIAALDYGLAETLIALDIAPIAIAAAQDWTRWVVEPPLPAGVVNLGTSREPNLELLRTLRPDVILVTPYLAGIAHRLEQVAPIASIPIYVPEGRPLALAEAALSRLAVATGRDERAHAVLASAEALFAACRARLAARPRLPVGFVSLMDARHIRVYGAKSLFQDVLDRIGLVNAWNGPTSYWGFATLGIEAMAQQADGTLFYLDPVPPSVLAGLAGNPIWTSLPAVRAGRTHKLPPVLMFGALPSAMRFARLVTEALTRHD